jgi:hypothetical protein
MDLRKHYESICARPSDINEHLPTLYSYAKKSTHVVEAGVRECVSTFAFLLGLLDGSIEDINANPGTERHDALRQLKMSCLDLYRSKNFDTVKIYEKLGPTINMVVGNCIKYHGVSSTMTFIDTWHVYPQLRDELAHFSKITEKYIILHDTTVDGQRGETIRNTCLQRRKEAVEGLWLLDIRDTTRIMESCCGVSGG